MGIRGTLVLTAAILCLSLTGTAEAAITVSSQADAGPGTLRQALAEAPPGETIVVPAGNYTLTSEPLKVTKGVTIAGHAAGDTTISAGGPFRVFSITGPLAATISGVTIRDGHATGTVLHGLGLEVIEADLTLRGVVVADNVADASGSAGSPGGVAQGGGIFVDDGSLSVIESQLIGNHALARGGSGKAGGVTQGGAIWASKSPVTIVNSTISGNSAEAHGGEGPANAAQNGGVALGGGVWVVEAPLTISDSSVTGNAANGAGGNGSRGGVTEGGGVFVQDGSVSATRTSVSGNSADSRGGPGPAVLGQFGGVTEGGGIFAVEGAVTLAEAKVVGNSALGFGGAGDRGGVVEGGGVWAIGQLTVTSSTISGNLADGHGGQGPAAEAQFGGVVQGGGLWAIQEKNTAPSSILASTIAENAVDGSGGPGARAGVAEGGGIMASAESPLSFVRSTVASNVLRANSFAAGGVAEGGGLWGIPAEAGILSLTAVTVSGNRLETAGPVIFARGGNLYTEKVAFRDSIVANGVGPAKSDNCNEEAGTSLGFNLESSDQCGFHAGGDQVNKDPLLGPLQDNGGPTATMALPPNSPAVDQGAAFGLTADQRGVQRPIDFPSIPNASAAGADGADVGAYELRPSNAFTLGKLKKNRKKGTATLAVFLPQPSVGDLTLEGKGLKTQKAAITGQAEVKLKVIPMGKARKALRKKGKRKIQIKVVYSPLGNAAAGQTRKAKLVRKHKKRHGKH